MGVRTIGTDIKLTGEKEFNDGMKAINSNLKTLRSDMAAVSATFEDNANSVESLTAKNKILQDSVDQQRVKVDALRQMYEKVAAASGENSAAADKWKQQLNNATVALAKEERALRQNNEALEAAKSAASSAQEAVDDLADANTDVARTADRAADELDDMGDKAERTGNILPGVVQGLGGLASGALQAGAAVVALGAAMGTAALTAMVSFARESAEAAQAAADAGETLSENQQIWLDFAGELDALENASGKAKRALGGVLLPQLSVLSVDGSRFLNNFAQSMEEAAGDTEKQAEVLSEYLVEGIRLIKSNFPEYLQVGRDLLGGLKEGFAEVAPELLDDGIDLVFDLLESILDSSDELSAGGQMLLDKLKAGLEGRGPELFAAAGILLGELVAGLGNNADDLVPIAGELILALVGGLTDSLPEIGAAAGSIIGELAKWLLDPATIQVVLDAALNLGEALAKAIWNALKGAFQGMFNLTEMIGPLTGDLGLSLSLGGIPGAVTIPGYAEGLDRVPYDNFLARLHKDEMILTAPEARLYRQGRGPGLGVAYNNLTMPIYVQSLTPEQLDAIFDYVNGRLGDGI